MDVRISRRLDNQKIRTVCMRYQLFTLGNNEDYANMFNTANSARTDDDFIQIAETIWNFSDKDALEASGFDFGTLCWYIFNECVLTIIS